MPIALDWKEITLRLALTVVAGGLIGLNRGERGQAAGLRTMLLVCLAASVAMIQVNLLLSLSGRRPDSFVMNDLMRLPLGILTGVGFIGGGAILRKDDMVKGVTTAATLWFVTVIGLCLGGGQIGVGMTALALGMGVLWLLRIVEDRMPRDFRANLRLTAGAGGPGEEELREALRGAGFKLSSCAVTYADAGQLRDLDCEVIWRASRSTDAAPPGVVKRLAQQPGVTTVRWQP
jgi:putative Mg2+ transporter-C (MgtC) family protein